MATSFLSEWLVRTLAQNYSGKKIITVTNEQTRSPIFDVVKNKNFNV